MTRPSRSTIATLLSIAAIALTPVTASADEICVDHNPLTGKPLCVTVE